MIVNTYLVFFLFLLLIYYTICIICTYNAYYNVILYIDTFLKKC
jgi:hypothetical protein